MRWLSGGIGLALIGAALALLVPAGQSAGVQRPAFAFGAPGSIPDAVAGQKYAGFSFCKPPPPGARQCGAGYVTRNPRGGIPPYTFSMRSVLPGLHVNLRTGLLFGTVPKGAQARKWSFTVCATESRTPKFQQPRTKCDETSITITRAEAPVTIGTYVTTMQGEAQKWRAAFARTAATSCAGYRASFARAAAEFSAFAARVSRIAPPSELKGAQEKLRQALTAMSESLSLWSASTECTEPTLHVPDAAYNKRIFVDALMRDWADAVVTAAQAKGLSVDRASLVCCLLGG